jgi:uncharacterized protein
LGFIASSVSNEHFVAFQASGIILCLYPTKLLAEDAKIDSNREGFRGVTLAYNVKGKKEVSIIFESKVTRLALGSSAFNSESINLPR